MIEKGKVFWHPKYGEVIYLRQGPGTAYEGDAIAIVQTKGLGSVMVRLDELRNHG